MKSTKRQQEIARERREAAGLPVVVCPQCGAPEAHWVADYLDQYGLVVPGYYICIGVS
jgi:hypothetical protein